MEELYDIKIVCNTVIEWLGATEERVREILDRYMFNGNETIKSFTVTPR